MRILKQIAQYVVFIAVVAVAGAGSALAGAPVHQGTMPTNSISINPARVDVKVDVTNVTEPSQIAAITGNYQVSVTEVSRKDPASGTSQPCQKVKSFTLYAWEEKLTTANDSIGTAFISNPDGLCSYSRSDYMPPTGPAAPWTVYHINEFSLTQNCKGQPNGTVIKKQVALTVVNSDINYTPVGTNPDFTLYYPVTITCITNVKAPAWGSNPAQQNAIPQKGGQINPGMASNKEKTQADMKLNAAQASQLNKMNWDNKVLGGTAGNKPNLHKPAGPTTGPKASGVSSIPPVSCALEIKNLQSNPQAQPLLEQFVRLWNNTPDTILAGSRISYTLTSNGKSQGFSTTITKTDEVPAHGSQLIDRPVGPALPAGASCSVTNISLATPSNPIKGAVQQYSGQIHKPPVKPESMNANTGKPPKKSDLLQDVMH